MSTTLERSPETSLEALPAAQQSTDVGAQSSGPQADTPQTADTHQPAAPASGTPGDLPVARAENDGEGEPSIEAAETPVAAPTPAERRQRVDNFLAQAQLPQALRERLADSLSGAEQPVDATSGEPLVPVSQLAAFFAQALPPSLRLDRATLGRPDHPAGEAFFTGDPEALTDTQAEQVAREQLARNGFLKKETGGR